MELSPENNAAADAPYWAWLNKILLDGRPFTLEGRNYQLELMRSKTEDQDALADAMTNVGRQMRDFIREVSRCRPTLGKPVVVGHSQGGMMSYAVAAVNPSGVKAAVPASGWLPRQMWPRKIAPTIALHGTQDLTVPYGRTADFIARAQSAGLPIEFIAITGQGHGLSGELRSKWKSAIDRVMRTGIA